MPDDSGLPEGHLSAERRAEIDSIARSGEYVPPRNREPYVALVEVLAELDRRAATIADLEAERDALQRKLSTAHAQRNRALAAVFTEEPAEPEPMVHGLISSTVREVETALAEDPRINPPPAAAPEEKP
jgi:hypothetical protein